jgi:cholesterol transport system auxiliary component
MRRSFPVRGFAAVGAALIGAAATGCASIFGGGAPQTTFFVWRDAGQAVPAAQASPRTLLLAPSDTAAFYDTQRIAFSRESGTRGQYQLAAWTDRPGKRFDVLLLERLDRRNAFAQVSPTTSGVRGDLMLATVILELYHDDVQSPGVARLRIAAELTDRVNRVLLARRTFVSEAPVNEANAQSALAGFDLALARLLDELLPWLEGEAAKVGPRRGS